MSFKWIIYFLVSLMPACIQKAQKDKMQLPLQDNLEIAIQELKSTTDYDTLEWKELIDLDTSLNIDIRYSSTNNFVGEKMYDCGRCFLRPEAARRIAMAHKALKAKGFGLKLYDCYRPRPFQQRLWDKVPDARYVTPPQKGSMHNRGLAVDLTIVNALGEELDMGTEYDYFGEEAYQDYKGLSEEVAQNRALLNSTMKDVGFSPIRTEWWHFSLRGVDHELADWTWPCY